MIASKRNNKQLRNTFLIFHFRLTFSFVVFLGRTPPDAGLVLVQVKESEQPVFLPLQFGHVSAGLHGAYTPLHFRDTQRDMLSRIKLVSDKYLQLKGDKVTALT